MHIQNLFTYSVVLHFLYLTCFTSFDQMADPVAMMIDAQGNYVPQYVHWEGFPLILWEVLSAAGYAHPPQYVAHEFHQDGVTRCRANFTLAAHPVHLEWPVLASEVLGHRLEDTWELAAL